MKREEDAIQKQLVQYIRSAYPYVLFRGNARDAGKMSPRSGAAAKALGQGRAWPDIVVYHAAGPYHGLFIELKKDRSDVYRKDGRIVADRHIQDQRDRLCDLHAAGYYADFAFGLREAIELVDWYMDLSNPVPPFNNMRGAI